MSQSQSSPAPQPGTTAAQVNAANNLDAADGGPRSYETISAQADYYAAPEGTQQKEYAWQQVKQFRAQQSALRRDEWKQYDENLREVATRMPTAVDDLRQRNLTVTTDLGTMVYEWELTDSFDDPQIDMGAETRGTDEQPTYDTDAVPLPIVHNSFYVNRRKLEASRRTGQPLDTVGQQRAVRSVNEGIEDLLFNGWENSIGGNTIHGYRTHPARETVTASNWTLDATTPGQIREDIYSGVEALENNFHPPGETGYILYLSRTAYQTLRRRDTGTDQERGLLTRMQDELGDSIEFKYSDFLPEGEAVLVQPSAETVQLIVASDMQNVEWSSHETMTLHMKVLASITPMIRADQEGQMGLAHFSGIAG